MKNVVQYNAFLEEVLHAIAKQLLDDCGHYLLGNRMIMHAFARGHIQQRNLLFDIIKSKHCLMDITLNRDPDALTCKLSSDEDIDACYAESTGARVKADSSVSLVYKYCEKIPRDNYFSPKPVFKFTECGGSYECTLTLPPNASFQKLVGPVHRNSHVAKQLVSLDACKKLHQLGVLHDHFLLFVEEF